MVSGKEDRGGEIRPPAAQPLDHARATGYLENNGQLYVVAAVPIRAPAIVGWWVVGTRVDSLLARSLREEVARHGIRVTTLLPGATYTASWAASGLPAERFMPAEDIAQVVVDLHRLTGRTVAEEVLLRPMMGDV